MVQKTAAPTGIFELAAKETIATPGATGIGIQQWELSPESWLPNSIGGFARFFIALVILVGGLTVHIYLSAQILEAQVNQQQLVQTHELIQRENAQLVWEITQYSAVNEVRRRAFEIGYTQELDRTYALAPITHQALKAELEIQTVQNNPDTEYTTTIALPVPTSLPSTALNQRADDALLGANAGAQNVRYTDAQWSGSLLPSTRDTSSSPYESSLSTSLWKQSKGVVERFKSIFDR